MRVIAIHPGDEPELLADFLEQTGITFPVVEDLGTLGKFAYPYGVGYPYPRDVVIDRNLQVRAIRNSFNVSEMQALVEALLDE